MRTGPGGVRRRKGEDDIHAGRPPKTAEGADPGTLHLALLPVLGDILAPVRDIKAGVQQGLWGHRQGHPVLLQLTLPSQSLVLSKRGRKIAEKKDGDLQERKRKKRFTIPAEIKRENAGPMEKTDLAPYVLPKDVPTPDIINVRPARS